MRYPEDWDHLAMLINQARGSYTFNRFAKECGVDAGYLSKITNHKLQGPPQPEILRKIANASQDDSITYKTLMEACGYLDGFDDEGFSYNDNRDELIQWATKPENREYIQYIYKYYQMGTTKELLKNTTLVINQPMDTSKK